MHLVPVIDVGRFTEPDHDTYVGDTNVDVTVNVLTGEKDIPFVNAAENGPPEYVKGWDSYVGQKPLKDQLRVHITASQRSGNRLDHILLASGMPGVGKTTLARLIAKELEAEIIMLVPPFSPSTLYEAAMSLGDGDVLFIDEIHKLADHGPRAAENLLHLLEEGVLYLDDGVHHLAEFTLIGATTDADKLPETIIDRFPIKPYFQPYSMADLVRIAKNFADFYQIGILSETLVCIAKASRGTPRIVRELVIGARDYQLVKEDFCTPAELLAFKEVEPDGMTRTHKAYIKAMFQFFGRETPDGNGWEYVAGEASLMSLLRENKPGIARLERFLIETGLVDRTPRGRRLTDRGVAKAKEYLAREPRLATA